MAGTAAMTQWVELPSLLLLSALLPLFVSLLLAVARARRIRRLAALGADSMIMRLVPVGAMLSTRKSRVLLTSFALLAAVAFAGPQWGSAPGTSTGSGIDIVLAMDASLSMLATDERPNRLERMKQEVRRLRAGSVGDRIGVIAFAGRSYILTPLTTDAGALDLFLDNLDPSIVGLAGSAVSRAIVQGTEMLLASESGSDRALIVLSDWESFDEPQTVLDAASKAREAGIHVVTVGFGTVAGSRIPVQAPGGRTTFKLDESGETVTSRYNAELQRAVAEAAGGVAIEASASDKAGRIRVAISDLATESRTIEHASSRIPRFQLFLLPAFLLLLFETLSRPLALRRARSAAQKLSPSPVTAAALVLLLLVTVAAQRGGSVGHRNLSRAAQEELNQRIAGYRSAIMQGDRSDRTLYNLGSALLSADSLVAAAEVLGRVQQAGDAEIRYRAAFNRGLAQLRAGLATDGSSREAALEEAIDSYREVLLMRPDDPDARWNYELALARRDEGDGGGGGGSDEQQEQPSPQSPEPAPDRTTLDEGQAERILDNAARDERDVQERAHDRNRPATPPGGKDW